MKRKFILNDEKLTVETEDKQHFYIKYGEYTTFFQEDDYFLVADELKRVFKVKGDMYINDIKVEFVSVMKKLERKDFEWIM